MPFKLNISDKGEAWKLETEAPALIGKSVGDTINGKDISADLSGYELEITGGSDISGFPLSKKIEGIGLKKVLLTKGWGMRKKPRWSGKKPVSTPKGLRLRKTVRGKTIAETTIQINIKVKKYGDKKLTEIFPEQNKPKETQSQKAEPAAQEVAVPAQ